MRSLAKLTPPKIAGAHPRQRLFEWFDGRRSSPVIWIVGPPGAGKTTLIASYIRARKLPRIWYQMDAADSDPATFFHYLQQAAPRRKAPLPLLTPEYLPDLAGFTHRFFRELFRRLPRPGVLILDNFQDAQESGRLYGVVRDAAAEIPEGINLIVISRAPPPAECARIQLNRTLASLEWEDLRLTIAETEAIASLGDHGRTRDIRQLHQRSGGWAAGLTVLVERTGERETMPAALDDAAPQALFDYFAAEI